MPAPSASRVYPDDTTDPSGMSGATYAEKVKANSEQLFNMVCNLVGSVSGTDTITGTCSPTLAAAPVDGQIFVMTPAGANSGAVTIELDSTGAKSLVSKDGTALAGGELASTDPIIFKYESATGKHRLLGLSAAQVDAKAAAAASAATLLRSIGSYTVTGSPTEKIFTWTADDYVRVVAIGMGISGSANGNFVVQIRTSGGTVMSTLTNTVTSANGVSFKAEWINDLSGVSTRRTYLLMNMQKDASALLTQYNTNSTTNVGSQIRFSLSAGHFDSGRIDVYGYAPAS